MVIAATTFVLAGYVKNQSVVVAVNGEGPRSRIYVIGVSYITCDPDIGVTVMVSAHFRLKFTIN
jgi:hypothetical protein